MVNKMIVVIPSDWILFFFKNILVHLSNIHNNMGIAHDLLLTRSKRSPLITM